MQSSVQLGLEILDLQIFFYIFLMNLILTNRLISQLSSFKTQNSNLHTPPLEKNQIIE